MKSYRTKLFILRIASWLLITSLALWQSGGPAMAQVLSNNVLYTTDADFDQGTLVSVNHNAPYNDQLQLDSLTKPFPFINVAASGRGTMIRSNTETGEIVGEYRTAPDGRGLNPSRTTVDLFGNVWTANRDEVGTIDGVPNGSAVKIGLIVGGTRVDETGSPNPDGGYLSPPFDYNTCVDRNGDGLIRTSRGLLDILDWPDITDGLGGAEGIVQDAVDECILIYQRLPDAEQARHVSVDADNNVWVGGYPFVLRMFYKLDGTTGTIIDSFDARQYGCGGYGGLIDGKGILWSVGGPLLRYDPVARTGLCIQQYGYGLGIDTNGYIWMSLWDGGIVKVAPDGTVVPGFPKPTSLPSMTTSPLTSAEMSSLQAALSQQETSVLNYPLVDESPTSFDVDQPMTTFQENGLNAALVEDPSVTFEVQPVTDWIGASSSWTPGANITLIIQDGGDVVYTDSQPADSNGNFNFNLWDRFDLQRGQVVTVSDGTYTKTHTVMNLFVDGVNIAANTISGRAVAGTSVSVQVNGSGGLDVTADNSGNWTADFSGQTDLTYLSDGASRQHDNDGDSTGIWWSGPRFQVAPVDEWVQSSGNWTSGATITLTIEDGEDVVYTDSQIADSNGNFNFNLRNQFDLQRGQVVTVSDGTNTKTHTVMNLYVDGVNIAADTVSGRGDASTDVEVWVHGGGWSMTTADGSGDWTTDFSSQTDLVYLSDGGSQQRDADGDATGVWWASPRFEVAPDDNWVQSTRPWTLGATITLTIEDGGGVVYSDSQMTDADGNFNFELWNVLDLQRGQVVTVSDGTTTKSHTVAGLFVDGVNVTMDTIFGRAAAGSNVDIWVHGDGSQTATADGSGNWTADFSVMTDLTYLSDGGSEQMDTDGDATRVWWSSPRFQVAPDDDWVGSWNRWRPATTITLTIEDGGNAVYSDSQMTDSNGNFNFNLWDVFDLQRGQVVTVSDGTTIKTHTVLPLYVDGVDITEDTVFGQAEPGTNVEVWVHGDGNQYETADSSGNWTADFSGQTDLTYISDGGSAQYDSDGDSTGVWWASPKIQVAPEDEWVQSWSRWTPGATITLTIEDGGVVVYSSSQTIDTNGYFNFNLWDQFDLQRGQVVTVSDGTTTKTHNVMPLYVDNVNVMADSISGRGDPGRGVEIWVHGDGNQYVTSDGLGNWTADFSSQTDLTYLSDGGSQQIDDDGDSTGVWWSSPSLQVAPDDQWVNSWNRWRPGTTVTLNVEESGVIVHTDSQTTDSHGNFNFNIWSVDLQAGHQITVTDGTTTKTHIITDINVTDIDTDADQIRGTAQPGAQVRVWVYLFNDGSERRTTVDLDGNWVVDFSVGMDGQPAYDITESTFINANEFDEDGDSTYRRFGPPIQQNRGVAVTLIDNHVWVANSGPAYGTVTRLDNDGNILKVIDTGQEPTGVAVDAAGKVWATNLGSDNMVRIDPNAGVDGLGAVDLLVDLGPGASPYNYSDMTGSVVVGSTSPQGFWSVVQDSQTPGFRWGRIIWNTEPEGDEPPGTAIVVEARAADSEAGLGGQTFQPIANDALFSMFGRFMEVRVTLKASPGGVSPVLSDIRIQPSNQPPTIISLVAPVEPGQINQAITATVTFEDPDPGDTHTADWDWGDGSTSTLPATLPTNSASHTYAAPGVYILSVTITDAAGASDTETFQYIVVYDPNGGFVTGGGWIWSPEGAYPLDPSLTGKATFGFVSKYQRGANIPTGNTEFQFHVANMNFKSTSYDWLVIAGSRAQYKGTGTINGAGEYKFILTAIDGLPDKFRIKIWDKATGEVIYDNQIGASDTADPSTAIQGGSIVIHKAR